jgi:sugar/nucleoside kinase (ribokinase family)
MARSISARVGAFGRPAAANRWPIREVAGGAWATGAAGIVGDEFDATVGVVAQAPSTTASKTKTGIRMARTMPFESPGGNACHRTVSGLKRDMTAKYDVVAVGNAIIDVIKSVSDALLDQENIAKGAMTLIDDARANHLTSLFAGATVAAGGSAANTATGIASFGGTAAYIGKVADDDLGAQFTREFRGAGVAFETPARRAPPGTARSLIGVTPDGQRSMNTYLGASTLLDTSDIDAGLIRSGATLFLEGYLFDRDEAKAAFVHAAEIARSVERKVALTLSDKFCVDRHRVSFQHLVAGHVDILFSNEAEILSLYETADLGEALATARRNCPVVIVTRSEKGSLIAADTQTVEVAPIPVARVVDTTGAGDQYAAGFLYGYAKARTLAECGALASLAASEVISHVGPRPETNLRALALKSSFRV